MKPNSFAHFKRNEFGQTLVEYALILLLFTVAVALVLPTVQSALTSSYTASAGAFPP